MRAMILAAGRGTRMRPLTDHCPKPLLKVGKHTLIEYHLFNLANANITEVIINHAWLGEQIVAYLGNGQRYGVEISYSAENPALETAGAISKALDFFANQAFLVINGDVWTDWQASNAYAMACELNDQTLANLVLVNNPEHKPEGDFQFVDGAVALTNMIGNNSCHIMRNQKGYNKTYTFSGIGVYSPKLFTNIDANKIAALGPILRQHIEQNAICGNLYEGLWFDVGTPTRLNNLNKLLNQQNS